MTKNNSVARSKESVTSVLNILAKEGLNIVLPGSGALYDISSTLVKHGKSYYSDRVEERMTQFHSDFLEGNLSEDEIEKLVSKEFELDDYYAVLSSCVQDMESEKTIFYASLMRGIILTNQSSGLRKHFIIVCKDLSIYDFRLLQKLYIYSNFTLINNFSVSSDTGTILKSKAEFMSYSVNKLIQLGLVNQDRTKLTQMGRSFIELVFDENQLQPEVIGRNESKGITLRVVSFNLKENNFHTQVAKKIQSFLCDESIISTIGVLKNNMSSVDGAILLVDEDSLDHKSCQILRDFSQKKPVIQINLCDQEKAYQVDGLSVFAELTIDKSDKMDIDKILQDLKSLMDL